MQMQNTVCELCAHALTSGTVHVAGEYGDIETLSLVDAAIDALPMGTHVDWDNPVHAIGTAVMRCELCAEIIADGYALAFETVAVDLPADVVRIPRAWHRAANGKATGPLSNESGALDVVIYRDDLETLLPAVTGWIGAGRFDSIVDRFVNSESGRTTDRAGALLESLPCTVTVQEWARGARPARGEVDVTVIASELPGSRRAARVATQDARQIRECAPGTGELLTFDVRGLRGVDDCTLTAPAGTWEWHIPHTAGWCRNDGNPWFFVLSHTSGAKLRRAVKKLIACGAFEVTPA